MILDYEYIMEDYGWKERGIIIGISAIQLSVRGVAIEIKISSL